MQQKRIVVDVYDRYESNISEARDIYQLLKEYKEKYKKKIKK